MSRHSFASVATPFASLLAVSTAAVAAGGITLNGAPVANVDVRPEISIDIAEFREGGSNAIELAQGPKRYKVSLVTRTPIAVLDGQLPVGANVTRFTVAADTGPTFQNCLIAGVGSEGSAENQRLVYALRCEDFAP